MVCKVTKSQTNVTLVKVKQQRRKYDINSTKVSKVPVEVNDTDIYMYVNTEYWQSDNYQYIIRSDIQHCCDYWKQCCRFLSDC